MTKFFIWLVMLFSGVWRAAGADLRQLRLILEMKLMTDNRTPLEIATGKRRKSGKGMLILGLIINFFIGTIYSLPLIFQREQPLTALTIYYTFLLFLLWFILIVSYSKVLVDTRENTMLLPLPISDKTLLLSRMLHIGIFLFRTILPISISGWVLTTFLFDWTAILLFPVVIVCLSAMALFLVSATYLMLIRVAGPSRFKDIIGTFQIILSILIFGSYYLTPRLLGSETLSTLDLNSAWLKLLPSFWFASVWTWFYDFPGVTLSARLTGLIGIMAPLVSLWITVRWLSPSFVRGLSGDNSTKGTSSNGKPIERISGRYRWLSRLFNRNKESRAGFELTWLMIGRSKDYKLKVYPSMVITPVYFGYLFYGVISKGKDGLEKLQESNIYLILPYLLLMPLIQAVFLLSYSDHYKASWIYHSKPISQPGNFLAGSLKAVLIKFFSLPYILITLACFALIGFRSLPELLLAFMNILIIILALLQTQKRAMPFSHSEEMKEAGVQAIVRLFAAILLIPIVAGTHYLTILFPMLKYIIFPLTALMLWLLWTKFRSTSWSVVNAYSNEG